MQIHTGPRWITHHRNRFKEELEQDVWNNASVTDRADELPGEYSLDLEIKEYDLDRGASVEVKGRLDLKQLERALLTQREFGTWTDLAQQTWEICALWRWSAECHAQLSEISDFEDADHWTERHLALSSSGEINWTQATPTTWRNWRLGRMCGLGSEAERDEFEELSFSPGQGLDGWGRFNGNLHELLDEALGTWLQTLKDTWLSDLKEEYEYQSDAERVWDEQFIDLLPELCDQEGEVIELSDLKPADARRARRKQRQYAQWLHDQRRSPAPPPTFTLPKEVPATGLIDLPRGLIQAALEAYEAPSGWTPPDQDGHHQAHAAASDPATTELPPRTQFNAAD